MMWTATLVWLGTVHMVGNVLRIQGTTTWNGAG